MSQEVAESRELAVRLPALRAELESATRSCASLQSTLEVAQANHASSVEKAARLERSLADSTGLVGPLEAKVRELSERLTRGVEDHVREMEGFIHKQRGLKEQLEASRAEERAAREELLALQGQVKNLKSTLLAASAGLQEQDNAVKGLQENLSHAKSEQTNASDSLKEKMIAMNKIEVQMELLQTDLEEQLTQLSQEKAELNRQNFWTRCRTTAGTACSSARRWTACTGRWPIVRCTSTSRTLRP